MLNYKRRRTIWYNFEHDHTLMEIRYALHLVPAEVTVKFCLLGYNETTSR
jgi:hypothetical protein